MIAKFYYAHIRKSFKYECNTEVYKGNHVKEDIIKYCYPFAEEGMKYINKGFSEGTDFLSEFTKLKELYKKYFDEVRALG